MAGRIAIHTAGIARGYIVHIVRADARSWQRSGVTRHGWQLVSALTERLLSSDATSR